MLKHKPFHMKIIKFSYEDQQLKKYYQKWTYHVHPLPLPNYLQNDISYEMSFTCISSGNSIHRNIFSYERRKDDKQDSYVQHKTFHMKITQVFV